MGGIMNRNDSMHSKKTDVRSSSRASVRVRTTVKAGGWGFAQSTVVLNHGVRVREADGIDLPDSRREVV